MRGPGREVRRSLPAIGAALSLTVIFVVVLALPLGVSEELALTSGQLTGWIIALYGVPGVLSLLLARRHRQPLLVTGNVFVLIFVASLGDQLSWSELIAASMVAGAVVLGIGLFGWTEWLTRWVPAAIVFGVLAGAVLPFFVGLFDAFGDARVVVGAAFVAYLLGRRVLGPRVPATLPALAVGLLVAGVLGELGAMPDQVALPKATLTAPAFSVSAVLTATPVMVVLITLQANVPSVVFLRSQGFQPPERTVAVMSGAGTLLGSLFGPIGVSLSLPATALAAGPDAGEHTLRHRAAYVAGTASIVIALLAGLAAELATIVLRPLLLAVVGLALISVLASALEEVVSGPLVLGPLFAFGIALSDLTLLGLGPFFWALAVGLAVSLLVERDEWRALRTGQPAGHQSG